MSTEPRVIAGRYRVDELIGHGGMAKVYRGYDLTLGREIAVKILDPDLARDTSFRTSNASPPALRHDRGPGGRRG
ncbi:hypothetical protein CTI14_46740, partial [Methylobacterium radiotolerans]